MFFFFVKTIAFSQGYHENSKSSRSFCKIPTFFKGIGENPRAFTTVFEKKKKLHGFHRVFVNYLGLLGVSWNLKSFNSFCKPPRVFIWFFWKQGFSKEFFWKPCSLTGFPVKSLGFHKVFENLRFPQWFDGILESSQWFSQAWVKDGFSQNPKIFTRLFLQKKCFHGFLWKP